MEMGELKRSPNHISFKENVILCPVSLGYKIRI